MAKIAHAIHTIEHVKTDLSQAINRKGDTCWHSVSNAGKGLFIHQLTHDDGVILITDNKCVAVMNAPIIKNLFRLIS
ncbi:non-ribosomal peptide synthetase [Pantoea sp. S62]|nr:non-ribosomal peptide synthetase [Pantoea sp. S62]